MGIMKKSKKVSSIVCCLLCFVLVILVLIKLGKPTVRIDRGLYSPSAVFGPHVAASKKMPTYEFSYKITAVGIYNFSAANYKKRNPTDIVLAGDRSAVILTHDPARFMHEVYQNLKMNWFRMELRDRDGEVVILHDEKYLGFF